MLRRSVLYLFRDTATSAERARLQRSLAFLGLECATVSSSDYGDDIAGGSRRLLEVPPWKRTPRFHARGEGPPSNYDLALHLGFADAAALAAYEGHPVRQEVARLAASVTVAEVTARVDWLDRRESAYPRGAFRHTALHVWRDEADEGRRARALEAVRSLAGLPGVAALSLGESASGRAGDFDWILGLELRDESAARALLASEPYAAALAAVAEATKDEWTARLTHLVRGS